ncbi:MAG: peptidase T [Otoolea sp.]|nr:peptidase T [Clostridium sp.]MDY5483357.1 peptidase T [Clostridium sp.]
MNDVTERFLRYVSYDTQSAEEKESVPSTDKQFALAELLAKELREMGAADVTVSDHAYVFATVPATVEKRVPTIGLIAHMDTSPDCSGSHVRPHIVENYDGGDVLLNKEQQIWLRVSEFPFLADCAGTDLIVTDGTTLLGADDKAGVAEIMAMAAKLLAHPEIPHGTIRIGFTPDEEVGRGPDFFDVKAFGADLAYTVDGGALGELEYENFNAASAKVTIHGVGIHPGSAKGIMKNASLLGMEFQSLLPVFENPMYTENYEGFFHLHQFTGDVETAKLHYLIRDHSAEKFVEKKQIMEAAAGFLNRKYGEGTVELTIRDSYRNMKEMVEPYPELLETAKAALKSHGVEPKVVPIRGGTDGARLSFLGLPCPNLCTGGYNYHGRFECIPVQSMEKMVEVLEEIIKRFAIE